MNWSRNTLLEHMSNFDVSDEAGQLVFADWLEEQGQLDWANLCRFFAPTSIARHQLPSDIFPEWIRYGVTVMAEDVIKVWKRSGYEI